jgi:hypothetical protein
MLFIKGRARKLDRTMEGIEKRSYELAKKFENNLLHYKNIILIK